LKLPLSHRLTILLPKLLHRKMLLLRRRRNRGKMHLIVQRHPVQWYESEKVLRRRIDADC